MIRLSTIVFFILVLLFCFTNLLGTSTRTFAPNLFISEYLEGSGPNDKGLEIFNGTGGTVNLNTYRLVAYADGSPTVTSTLTLGSYNLLYGNTYTIVKNGANSELLIRANQTTSIAVLSFTGNDAIVLQKTSDGTSWTPVDIFGRIGDNPGVAWTGSNGYSTVNKTLVRRPNVYNGITTNPTGTGATAFATLTTEWDWYPVDTYNNFGSHYFNPGVAPAEPPVFTPASGIKLNPINVTMNSITPGAQIRYTLDGTDPTELSTLYTRSIYVESTSSFRARTFAAGYSASAFATALYTFPIPVYSIANLRSQPTGTTVYKLTSEAVITFTQDYHNQKYIQDDTGAIVIDDPYPSIITTTYSIANGITGISGRLNEVDGMMQLTPVVDPGPPSHTHINIEPTLITLTQFNENFEDFEAQLVRINNLNFIDLSNPLFSGGQTYMMSDGIDYINFRASFFEVDYIGTEVPAYQLDVIGLLNSRLEGNFITARKQSDLIFNGTLPPEVGITLGTNSVVISWTDVPGALSYRVEASNSPFEGFVTIPEASALTTTTWTEPNSEEKKFYRVIAQ